MKREHVVLEGIPAIIWGEKSDRVYLYVHGKMSNKEYAKDLSEIVVPMGYQVLSFDLPMHGERVKEDYPCDIWNGIHDLSVIGDYVEKNWKEIYLYACSLGAFFSLHAYQNLQIESCLFQSPLVDMNYMIHQMFQWFGVTEEELKEKQKIETPVDTLSWEYYRYVLAHPITRWEMPTRILYGSEDVMQSRTVIDDFVNKFNCTLTVSVGSHHPFDGEGEPEIAKKWLEKCCKEIRDERSR